MKMVDLHIHSNHSDGTDSVEELADKLKEIGITVCALTDHDTVDGCDKLAQLLPERIRFYKGIEFSCVTQFGKCHILGYGVNTSGEYLIKAIDAGREKRAKKLKIRLAYLKETFDIVFPNEEVKALSDMPSVGKPHIAQLMVKQGLASSVQEAIKTYMSAFPSETDRLDAKTAVGAILSSDGTPVWAHPLGGEGEKPISEETFYHQLELLLSYGLKGLECCYSRYNIEQRAFLLDAAKKHHLTVTGGSDYHGATKDILPGCLSSDGTEAEQYITLK